MKGGGQPSAALAVGSRAVGKRKTLYDTTVTATNGISVHPAHSLIMRNPSIAGFISPRATQFLASQNPSTSSSPHAKCFGSRDCPAVQQPLLPSRDRHVRRFFAHAMIRRSWNDGSSSRAVEVPHVSRVARRGRTASPYASHGGRFGLRRRSGQRQPTLQQPHGGSRSGEQQASFDLQPRLSKTGWRTQIA
jgi:hypothetical protein